MNYKKIIVSLVGRDDEVPVIREAVHIARKYRAKLIAVHVNDPHAGKMTMMMDSVGQEITEADIRELFKKAGHPRIAKTVEVRILTAEHVPAAIENEAADADLLILGHRKMSTFKANFMDSVDEGIVNHVDCPVLVIPKPPKKK